MIFSPFFLYFGKCQKVVGNFYVYIFFQKIPSLVFLHVRVLLFLRHYNQYCKAEWGRSFLTAHQHILGYTIVRLLSVKFWSQSCSGNEYWLLIGCVGKYVSGSVSISLLQWSCVVGSSSSATRIYDVCRSIVSSRHNCKCWVSMPGWHCSVILPRRWLHAVKRELFAQSTSNWVGCSLW